MGTDVVHVKDLEHFPNACLQLVSADTKEWKGEPQHDSKRVIRAEPQNAPHLGDLVPSTALPFL